MHLHFYTAVAGQLAGVWVILFRFSWRGLAVALGLHAIIQCLGVTIGYHRCISHGALRLWKPLEYLFALLGNCALHGNPVQWATIHRQHHRFSDRDGDPHDSRRGLLYSHMVWFDSNFFPRCTPALQARYAPDLLAQGFYRHVDAAFAAFNTAGAIGLYLAFGFVDGLLWGGVVRYLIGSHATFAINSVNHAFGYRAYPTGDRSTNCAWLALPTFGESWHNNHHAFPSSARAGLARWEVDPAWWVIRALEATGLATHVRTPSAAQAAAARPPVGVGQWLGVTRPPPDPPGAG